MADSVSAQKERDLAVPLTWLCHPTLDSGSARSGGRGAARWKRRAASCSAMCGCRRAFHVSLRFRLNLNSADNSEDICNINACRHTSISPAFVHCFSDFVFYFKMKFWFYLGLTLPPESHFCLVTLTVLCCVEGLISSQVFVFFRREERDFFH